MAIPKGEARKEPVKAPKVGGEQALIKAPMKPVRAPVVMLKVVGQESAKVPVKAPVIVQTKAPVRAPVVMPLKAPPKAKAMLMHQTKADLKIIREVVLWKEGPKVKGGKGAMESNKILLGKSSTIPTNVRGGGMKGNVKWRKPREEIPSATRRC